MELRAEFGEEPDVDEIYNAIMARMQSALNDLAAERLLPLIG